MNTFTFTGNIGQDCEQKYLQSGTAICSFSVAVTSGYGDKKKTTWVKCSLFGKRAEGGLPQYLVKGAQVAVSGEVSLDEWTGQDGQLNKTLSVSVEKIDLIGGNKQQVQQQASNQQSAPLQQQYQQQAPQQYQQQNGVQGHQPTPQQNQQQAAQMAPQPQGFDDDFDSSIPF